MASAESEPPVKVRKSSANAESVDALLPAAELDREPDDKLSPDAEYPETDSGSRLSSLPVTEQDGDDLSMASQTVEEPSSELAKNSSPSAADASASKPVEMPANSEPSDPASSEGELALDAGVVDSQMPTTGTENSEPLCGNDTAEAGEECDGEVYCGDECTVITCGNAIREAGEQCDPPAEGSCSSNCQMLECGNGRVDDEIGEECEPPSAGNCTSDCLIAACGNERVDAQTTEECDPPNGVDCDDNCLLIHCGNGRIDPGEGCDPPEASICSEKCRPIDCGDTIIEGIEECDPPEPGLCDGSCREIRCGNGRIESEHEECEPPNTAVCSASCLSQICGNSRIDEGEECDPPAAGSCDSACRLIECGNGRLDDGEACDPELGQGDECSQFCTLIDTTQTAYLDSLDDDIAGWRVAGGAPDRVEDSAVLTHVSSAGSPELGALNVTVELRGAQEKLELSFLPESAISLEGTKLAVKVQLLSGLSDSDESGSIKLYAKAGPNYDYISGPWIPLAIADLWVDILLDAANPELQPGDFDPSDVREVGLELKMSEGSASAAQTEMLIDSLGLSSVD